MGGARTQLNGWGWDTVKMGEKRDIQVGLKDNWFKWVGLNQVKSLVSRNS